MGKILGLGLDLADAKRIENAVSGHGEGFLEEFLTATEIAACLARKDPFPCYAARFAAKEALVKALGTGFEGNVSPLDIQVERGAGGRPELRLQGEARIRADRLGVGSVHVSLTHEGTTAAAVVILEG